MGKKKKNNEILYSKPSKLLPFVDNIELIKANIKKFDEKLFHLQNKMNFTLSMSREGMEETPEFKKLEEKKLNLKEKRRLENEYVLNSVNSIITSFRDIQISDFKDIDDIKRCIDVCLANSKSEADKGAILSNITTLHVDDSVKENFYNEIERYIAKDKEILTGFLMHTISHDENRSLAYSVLEPASAVEELFKNSIALRAKDKKAAAVSDIILQDRAYLEKLFVKLGTNAKKLEKIKGLTKQDKTFIKKEFFKYKVETNTKPKLGSGLLTYSAKLPGTVSKVIKGTFSAVGSVFMLINWTFISLGVIISAPFEITKMGIEGLNTAINKNRTYKHDMKDIYSDVTKALKRSGKKFKYINDLKINIDETGNLSISVVMNKKHHEQDLYEVKYALKEGEYKNFKNIMKENFADKQTGKVNDFEVGQKKKKLDVIRFMRRLAEVTKEGNVIEVNYLGSFDESIQEIGYEDSKDYSYQDEKEEDMMN